MFAEAREPGPRLHERILRQVHGCVPVVNHTEEKRVYQPSVVIDQPAEGLPVALAGKPDTRNFDVASPLEWIARITSHIPRKGAKQVIYYGAYSQAWRGREHRQGILPKASGEEKSASSIEDRSSCSRRRRQLWAVLLKKVWDVDALRCPKCGGQMKVISFIEQPSVIRRILKHLDLWKDARPPPEPLKLVCEPCADYVPWKDDVPEIEVG